MPFVSAHDLETGAAFVLSGNARCVPATAALLRHEIDHRLDLADVDTSEVMPIASFPAGTVVYVELNGPRWIKLKVLPTR